MTPRFSFIALTMMVILMALSATIQHSSALLQIPGKCEGKQQHCTYSPLTRAKVCYPVVGGFEALSAFSSATVAGTTTGFRRVEWVDFLSVYFAIGLSSNSVKAAKRGGNPGDAWSAVTMPSTAGIASFQSIAVLPNTRRVVVTVQSNFTCAYWTKDLVTWTAATCADSGFYNVFWDPIIAMPNSERLIMSRPVSSAGTSVAVSDDYGSSWSLVTLGFGGNWRNICYARFANVLVMPSSHYIPVAYSMDAGATWTAGTYPVTFTEYDWWDCAAHENNNFISMVASGPNDLTVGTRIAISYDGINWSYVAGQTNTADLKRIRYIPPLNRLAAVPEDSNDARIWSTTDGLVWNISTSPSNTLTQSYDLAWNDKTLVVIASGSSTRHVSESTIQQPVACGSARPLTWCPSGSTCKEGMCDDPSCAVRRYTANSSSTWTNIPFFAALTDTATARWKWIKAEHGLLRPIAFRVYKSGTGMATVDDLLYFSMPALTSTVINVRQFWAMPISTTEYCRPVDVFFASTWSAFCAVCHNSSIPVMCRVQYAISSYLSQTGVPLLSVDSNVVPLESRITTVAVVGTSSITWTAGAHSPYLNISVVGGSLGQMAYSRDLINWKVSQADRGADYGIKDIIWCDSNATFISLGIPASGSQNHTNLGYSNDGINWIFYRTRCTGSLTCSACVTALGYLKLLEDAHEDSTSTMISSDNFGEGCEDPRISSTAVTFISRTSTTTVKACTIDKTTKRCIAAWQNTNAIGTGTVTDSGCIYDPLVDSIIWYRDGLVYASPTCLGQHECSGDTSVCAAGGMQLPGRAECSNTGCMFNQSHSRFYSFLGGTKSVYGKEVQRKFTNTAAMVEKSGLFFTPHGRAGYGAGQVLLNSNISLNVIPTVASFAYNTSFYALSSYDPEYDRLFIDYPMQGSVTSQYGNEADQSPLSWSNVTLDSATMSAFAPVVCSRAFGTCVTGPMLFYGAVTPTSVGEGWHGSAIIYLSEDGGATFKTGGVFIRQITDARFNNSASVFRSVSVAYSDTLKVFVASILWGTVASPSHYTLHSDDGGRSWTASAKHILVTYTLRYLVPKVIWNADHGAFAISTNSVLMLSENGRIWTVHEYSTSSLNGNLGANNIAWIPQLARYALFERSECTDDAGFSCIGTNVPLIDATVAKGLISFSKTDSGFYGGPWFPAFWDARSRGFIITDGSSLQTEVGCQPFARESYTFVNSSYLQVCTVDVSVSRTKYENGRALYASQRTVTARCNMQNNASFVPTFTCGDEYGVPTPCVYGKETSSSRTFFVETAAGDDWYCNGTSLTNNTACTARPCNGGAVGMSSRDIFTKSSTQETDYQSHTTRSCTITKSALICGTGSCTAAPTTDNKCSLAYWSGEYGTVYEARCSVGTSATFQQTTCGSQLAGLGTALTCTPGIATFKQVYSSVTSPGTITSSAVDIGSPCAGASTSSVTNVTTCAGNPGLNGGWYNETTITGTQLSSRFQNITDTTPYSCTREYNIKPCTLPGPVNCTVSAWSPFTACMGTYDGYNGYSYRTRNITVQPFNGGAACPVLIDMIQCQVNRSGVMDIAPPLPTPLSFHRCIRDESSELTINTSDGKTYTIVRNLYYAEKGNSSLQPYNMSCWDPLVVGTTETFAPGQFRNATTGYYLSVGSINNLTTCQEVYSAMTVVSTYPHVQATSVYVPCQTISCGLPGISQQNDYQVTIYSSTNQACRRVQQYSLCTITTPCDCEVSAWSAWSACSATCGGGTRNRSRTITVQPLNGGAACPALSETETCNTQCCATNCTLTEWSSYGACNETCGDGYQTRTRSVVQPASCGGTCPATSETISCNAGPCPVACVVGNWSEWSNCSVICGNGTTFRTREILYEPTFGGDQCPNLVETDNCTNADCSEFCEFTYSGWSQCAPSCGPRSQTRTITVAGDPLICGTDSVEQRPCDTVPCPVNCILSNWTFYSECNATCGGGYKNRNRTVLVAAQYGGDECEALTEFEPCNTNQCGRNCEVSAWSDWTPCTASCNGGVQARSRNVTVPSIPPGEACPTDMLEVRACNIQECTVDCFPGPWSLFGDCYVSVNSTVKCGSGTGVRIRTRSIITPAAGGGSECTLIDTTPCNLIACTNSSQTASPTDAGCFPCNDTSSGSGSGSNDTSSSGSGSGSGDSSVDIVQVGDATPLDDLSDSLSTEAWIGIGVGAAVVSIAIVGVMHKYGAVIFSRFSSFYV